MIPGTEVPKDAEPAEMNLEDLVVTTKVTQVRSDLVFHQRE